MRACKYHILGLYLFSTRLNSRLNMSDLADLHMTIDDTEESRFSLDNVLEAAYPSRFDNR